MAEAPEETKTETPEETTKNFLKEFQTGWGEADLAARKAVETSLDMDADGCQTFLEGIKRATKVSDAMQGLEKSQRRGMLLQAGRQQDMARAQAIKRQSEANFEMYNSWCKSQDGSELTAKEQKLADQFEKMSEKERFKVTHGISQADRAKLYLSGWGSDPLPITDAFVVESERSPGGTHRQRKRTARERAVLDG